MRTGDPIYLKLVKRMEVQVGYRLLADEVGRSTGTVGLDARISGSDGWQRTVRVAAPMRFAGQRVGMVAQVDLAGLAATLRRARERTDADGTFWIDIVPRVSLDAVVDGERRSLGTSPAFGFRMGDDVLVPDAGLSGTRGAPMTQSATSQERPAGEIPIGGRDIGVGNARIVSLGLALGAMLLTGLGLLRWPNGRAKVADRAGRRAIAVDDAELLHPAIDVGTLDDLLDVAERYDRPLMHVHTRHGDTYLVEDRGVRYRFGRTALLPVPEPRFVPDPIQAATAAEHAPEHTPEPAYTAEPEYTPAAEHAPEPEDAPEPEHAPESPVAAEPEPVPFAEQLAWAQDELAGHERFAVDELLEHHEHDHAEHQPAADHEPEPAEHHEPDGDHDLPVQRSVPEIELAPAHEAHEPRHAPRHRREVDLTEPSPAPPPRAERPDPVQAALQAAVSAVPPQRRPATDAEPKFRIAEPPPGVEQLRSWLRT
jgi:hypothetical protein